MNAKTTLENVRCARLPASSLACLAGLRRDEGVSVLHDGERSWVFWDDPDARVLRAVQPVSGVELFERRDGAWHRPGQHLPCFEVPEPVDSIAIDRVIFPAPFEAVAPGQVSPVPSRLRLVREGAPRPSTAALCPLAELGSWAETAPSHAIEAIRGAIQGDLALLLGRGLPAWAGSTRYWGDRLLVPVGFHVRPDLPEEVILEALGGSGLEVHRLIPGRRDRRADDRRGNPPSTPSGRSPAPGSGSP